MSFIEKGKERAMDYDLFLERLEMLYDQSLTEIRAFAEREARPFEEVRKRVAELHCKYLFDQDFEQPSGSEPQQQIREILRYTSERLESLETIAGLQSFFLVVNPRNSADEGFLGGTLLGREFWRGRRGCGVPGAEAFKAQCAKASGFYAGHGSSMDVALDSDRQPAQVPRKGARSLKADLYAGVRNAIRAASGLRNAEMRWKDHSKLDAYGIRLVGWPENVPLQNPSTMSVAQNKLTDPSPRPMGQHLAILLCLTTMTYSKTPLTFRAYDGDPDDVPQSLSSAPDFTVQPQQPYSDPDGARSQSLTPDILEKNADVDPPLMEGMSISEPNEQIPAPTSRKRRREESL
ncbi:hypothetical protein A0H81_07963 [Grifola frondosa]|uniref:Uncharacterized protein n=1 Tax=Grifola frondosa TaxID=5627 RepID=A0A1C7M5F0_GRIFR|nr:hypothetical protein A0H81_07963 [Grifola frondosa]